MSVRTHGLIALLLAAIAPLAVHGIMALAQAQDIAAAQAHEGHRRLARAIADRVAVHAAAERELAAAIGAAVWHAGDAPARQRVLDAYRIDHPRLADLVVYDAAGQVMAGQVPENHAAQYRDLAGRALAGERAHASPHASPVDIEAPDAGEQRLADALTIGEPLVVAGRRRGAIVARIDLAGIRAAVDSVPVGHTGAVRLLAHDGRLPAPADAQEPRLAAMAPVSGFPAMVVVEQPVDEAVAGVGAMQIELALAIAATLAFALALALTFGRKLVHGLAALRAHARELAGDLQRTPPPRARRADLAELRAVADALDDMARARLDAREQERERERLTTFTRVAAALTHDLRLPIEAVRSAMDVVARGPDDPAAQRLVARIREHELPRLKRWIDDLGRLAHRGNVGLVYERVDPIDLLAEIRAELADAPKWYGVSFEIRGHAGPAIVDRSLVRRAIVNLAANAAEACLALGPGGTATLELAGDDDVLEIRVSDTGVGLPPERVAALEHSDLQSTKRTTGVGLGLGVVKQVLSAHEGSLTIASTVGVGSVFTIRLPRAARPQRELLHVPLEPDQPGPARARAPVSAAVER